MDYRKIKYVDFIKQMKKEMEEQKKEFTATEEELDIARKILTGKLTVIVRSYVRMADKYDYELWNMKKGQLELLIGHENELSNIITYIRAEYFLKAAREIIKDYGIPGCDYSIYASSNTVLSSTFCFCANVYLGITFNEEEVKPEEFFYRINPSSVAFLWYQVNRNEDGSFEDEE